MGYTQVEAGENVGWDISGFVCVHHNVENLTLTHCHKHLISLIRLLQRFSVCVFFLQYINYYQIYFIKIHPFTSKLLVLVIPTPTLSVRRYIAGKL